MSMSSPRTTCCSRTRRRPIAGFTLIEVMITVLVLAIGLLGIVKLQVTAKKSTHQAWQRSLAVNLADNIIERIRINPSRAADYHTGLGTAALGGGTISTAPKSCATDTCSPDEVVAWDLWSWEQLLDGKGVHDVDANRAVGGLLDPHGCIVFQEKGSANTGLLRVTITWQGTTEISDAVTDNVCGSAAAGTQKTRRQVVVNTYVVDEGG